MERLISLGDYVVILLIAWLLSSNRRQVPWRVVIGGTTLQFGLALVLLKTQWGRWAFDALGEFMTAFLDFSSSGAEIVFPGAPAGHVAFRVLPTIVFISCLMSVLYHLRVMPMIVRGFAWVMRYVLGTSGPETFSASANIFLGQMEAPKFLTGNFRGE